jgi:uroporphyrinogen decarboxylase
MPPTPRDRVLAAMRNDFLDRPCFAVWRHFYAVEGLGPRQLAEGLVAFVRRHELDLLKYNPRAHYHAEPWGTRFRYSGGDEHPTLERHAVNSVEDWRRIDRRRVNEPVFVEMLEGLRIARAELPDVPLLMTIFVPVAILTRLAGIERALADLREHPEEVRPALEAVTATFADFARACVDGGADGIFLATTPAAQKDVLSDEEYVRFGRTYDLRILAAVADAPFNVLHVCGAGTRVFELADYPVAAISWNVHGEGNPSVRVFLDRVHDRVAIGGYSDEAFTSDNFGRLSEDGNALPWLDRRWIAAGGCTIPTTSRPENIDIARDLVRMRLREGDVWRR